MLNRVLAICMIVFGVLFGLMAEAGSWGAPGFEKDLRVTSTMNLNVATGTSSTVQATGYCTSSAVYRFRKVKWTIERAGISEGVASIYKQTCL